LGHERATESRLQRQRLHAALSRSDAHGCSTSRHEFLTAAWSGEPVHHRGEHYTVDGMRFLPRPVQRPGVPV
jgi:alkanesulfonate monooxygenase SsuD/methylene tetrahydromethanopterin reductase-like flavin-dependent oxidoreductase (luciferase family)